MSATSTSSRPAAGRYTTPRRRTTSIPSMDEVVCCWQPGAAVAGSRGSRNFLAASRVCERCEGGCEFAGPLYSMDVSMVSGEHVYTREPSCGSSGCRSALLCHHVAIQHAPLCAWPVQSRTQAFSCSSSAGACGPPCSRCSPVACQGCTGKYMLHGYALYAGISLTRYLWSSGGCCGRDRGRQVRALPRLLTSPPMHRPTLLVWCPAASHLMGQPLRACSRWLARRWQQTLSTHSSW
jgi:hypothetical protein